MYQRNIFHILFPIACLIGLFLAYQVWFKPTYQPTPPSQPAAVVEQSPEPPPEPHHESPPEPKQARLIDSSVVPDTTHHKLLETIRDEIEKGECPFFRDKRS